MLVLTRPLGTAVIIGEGENLIEVVILGINGNQIKVGIDAPRSIPVHRKEVFDKINLEKR